MILLSSLPAVAVVSPAVISPAVISPQGTAPGVCPTAEVIDAQRNAIKQEIQDLLRHNFIMIPALSSNGSYIEIEIRM